MAESGPKSSFAFQPHKAPPPPSNVAFRSLPERAPAVAALKSTFLPDVDRASCVNVRRVLSQNVLPAKDEVRLEELINEVPCHDDLPSIESLDPLAVNVEIADCPWEHRHRLARIGIAARAIDQRGRSACNFVFLLDLSPSMQEPDRLPILQWSLNRLIDQLGSRDRMAIVGFGQNPGVVLSSTTCSEKPKIRAAVDDLKVEAPETGRSALALAYEIASRNLLSAGTNRVILATDSSARIGAMRERDLTALVVDKAASGVSLSVLGVGSGTFDDRTITNLAEKGRGHDAHVTSPIEAYRVLVEEMGLNLATIATDARVQVEFNGDRVSAYKLIGYDACDRRGPSRCRSL
jgi:Ca-activated chloride channel family protein